VLGRKRKGKWGKEVWMEGKAKSPSSQNFWLGRMQRCVTYNIAVDHNDVGVLNDSEPRGLTSQISSFVCITLHHHNVEDFGRL